MEDAPSISPDGASVLYESWDWFSDDDYLLYLYDRTTGISTLVGDFA